MRNIGSSHFPNESAQRQAAVLRAGLTALLATLTLALAACGKSPDAVSVDREARATGTAAAAQGSARTDQQAAAKLNAYTDAYNKLIGTSGLVETHARYFNETIPSSRASDRVADTCDGVAQGLEQMRNGRVLPTAGLDALDKSADELITPLDQLVTQLKANKNNKPVQGNAQDPELRTLLDTSMAAMNRFNTMLEDEQKKRSAVALASLRESGDLVAYGTQLALQQGEELVSVFGNEGDIKAPVKYQQADAIAASLEKTLAEQREQYATAKAKGKHPDYSHESANGYLVSLIGAYRDMKKSKKASAYDSMVESYNSAVESARN